MPNWERCNICDNLMRPAATRAEGHYICNYCGNITRASAWVTENAIVEPAPFNFKNKFYLGGFKKNLSEVKLLKKRVWNLERTIEDLFDAIGHISPEMISNIVMNYLRDKPSQHED